MMQTQRTEATSRTKPAADYSKDLSYAARKAETFSYEDIARKMKMNYQHGTRDTNQRTLEILQKILELSRSKNLDVNGLLHEAANYIRDQYRLRWVAIGLRSPKDGLFRYEALVGFRDEAAVARKKQTFKIEDFTTDARYKGRTISEYTKMYFEEDKPYEDGSEQTFNRPALLKSKRHSPDDALEADYLDFHIYGHGTDLIGWIETSGTIMGKLPDVPTIKAIEVVASIIGSTIIREKK